MDFLQIKIIITTAHALAVDGMVPLTIAVPARPRIICTGLSEFVFQETVSVRSMLLGECSEVIIVRRNSIGEICSRKTEIRVPTHTFTFNFSVFTRLGETTPTQRTAQASAVSGTQNEEEAPSISIISVSLFISLKRFFDVRRTLKIKNVSIILLRSTWTE